MLQLAFQIQYSEWNKKIVLAEPNEPTTITFQSVQDAPLGINWKIYSLFRMEAEYLM